MTGIPGVASDGANGEIVSGSLLVGAPPAGAAPTDGTLSAIFGGFTAAYDTPANITNGWDTCDVVQSQDLTADYGSNALFVGRYGALNGHEHTAAVVSVTDHSLSTANLVEAQKGSTVVLRVNGVGGIGFFGHAVPAAQPAPTIATSTITDAAAKAAIKALILIINNCGLAAITES